MALQKQALAQGVLGSLQVVESQMDKEVNELDQQLSSIGMENLREKRFQYLKHLAAKKQEYIANGHGTYADVTDTKEFFRLCKQSERVVVHFYRGTTKRCEIVDKHLTLLSTSHMETRFLKVNVEKHPFLCERLQIVVLPSIVVVINGRTEKTFVGFEDFGNTDNFSTQQMEERLKESGALTSNTFADDAKGLTALGEVDEKENEDINRKAVRQSKLAVSSDGDSDGDW